MNAVILVVEIPVAERDLGLKRDYERLLANRPANKEQNEGSQRLAENVWLIELPAGLLFLAELIQELRGSKVFVRLVPLSECPSPILIQKP
jgi:hypothetical protein